MLTREEYEAKRQRRYERLLAAAQKAETESEAARRESDRISSFIPLGQPILIGHHSEKRHRRDLETIRNKARKGYELAKKAEEYRSRAASVEANEAIYTDDPQAVEKLGDKLEMLLELQATYKAINAAHAKFLKNPASLDKSDLTEAQKNLVRTWQPAYSFEKHPIQPYKLSNLSAQIRTAKKRAEQVEKQQAIPDKDEEVNGARVEWRAGENRIRVYFGKRVDLDTFKALKRHGFRVLRSEGEGAFSAYYNRNAADFIHNMKKGL